jgi:PBSX family phage terminase large subunit
VRYKPLTGKALASVDLATRRLNIWEGAVRSSKTIASIIAWLKFVRSAPPGDLAMIGKTERTLKRNVIMPIVDMIGQKRARYIEGAGELWILDRRIWLLGANDVKAEGKLRGMSLAGVYVDEITLMPEGMWRMLGTRLSEKGARLYGTTNPDNPRHWFKAELDRADLWLAPDGALTNVVPPEGSSTLDMVRMSFLLADNPHLDPAYLAALNAEYTGLYRRRYILGEWVVAEGSIYDMWDPARHVVPNSSVPDGVNLVSLGVDYGTRHRFAAEMIGTADGKLWVTDEWMWDSRAKREQLAPVQYSRHLREWLGDRTPSGVYVDPAAADFRRQLWVDKMRGVTLAENDVAPGIRTVASALSAGRLLVSERCEGLIETIGGYSWDEKAALLGLDKPVKEADDELDALRYGVHSSRWLWESSVPLA